ncbi:MAG: hypothetical protein L0177_18980 [Chloroflexi bacterium]|nr:hypothetical protein [Chloroflexota bacterium]
MHDRRLEEHGFIDPTRRDTLVFEEVEIEGVLFIHLEGDVYCLNGVTLEVEKWFETRETNNGLLQVRGITYRYIGYVQGGNLALKYHNLHADKSEYIHRVYDPATGDEIFYERLTREQFPIMTEVLDELEILTSSSE